jgi:poly(beta-D-mannuronate) lyase
VRQITPEGTLPPEMRRGQRALHYHLYAIAPLVYLAEFGENNGIALFAENNFALSCRLSGRRTSTSSPDPEISSLIAQAQSLSYMYLGGLPPY